MNSSASPLVKGLQLPSVECVSPQLIVSSATHQQGSVVFNLHLSGKTAKYFNI